MSHLGANVACVDIDVENCEYTVQVASNSLGVAKMYTCDVTNKDEASVIYWKQNLYPDIIGVTLIWW